MIIIKSQLNCAALSTRTFANFNFAARVHRTLSMKLWNESQIAVLKSSIPNHWAFWQSKQQRQVIGAHLLRHIRLPHAVGSTTMFSGC